LKGHLHTPGHIIPFIVWETDIPLHSPKIIIGSKVVIQDAYIAPFNTDYDKTSTVSFQVTLKSHSVITNTGETEDEEVISKYLKMELEEIENASDGIFIGIFIYIHDFSIINCIYRNYQWLCQNCSCICKYNFINVN
jgi:hypothetical protein